MVYIPELHVPRIEMCRHASGLACRPFGRSCAWVLLTLWPFRCPLFSPVGQMDPSAPGRPDEASPVGGGS
jgi:hypothetical protein